MPTHTDLTEVSTADLTVIRGALERGDLRGPLTASALAHAGLAVDGHAAARALGGLPAAALAPVIDAALAERRRPKPRLQLVWTGPEPHFSPTRDSRLVLRDLFAKAQREVLVVGFSFDDGDTLFAPLHAAMAERDVACRFFIDIPGDQLAAAPSDAEPLVRAHAAIFLARNWPWRLRPTFHYDPRRFERDVFASLHAKCVVVDQRYTLVTSANFTNRGQTRNVEVGALVDDPGFARSLAGQLHRCTRDGLFARVPDAWLPPPPPPAPEKDAAP